MTHRLSFLIPLVMGCGLVACDSDYGSIDKDPYPANVPLSGIWSGTYTITPTDTTAAVQTVNMELVGSETNEFWIIEDNVTLNCTTVGYGSANSNQANIQGSYGWGANCTFPDGSINGNATFSGTAALHDTLSVTINKLTAKGTTVASFSPDLTFQGGLYLAPSSLAAVAGSYTDNGAALSIDASGKITEAAVTGTTCTGSGQVSLINSTYNLYRVQFTYASCTDAASMPLNNVTLTGLGYLDTTASPSVFIATFHGAEPDGTPLVGNVAYQAVAAVP